MPKKPTRSIPVYTASGERMPLTFDNFDAAEEFQRTVIADLTPFLLSQYIGIGSSSKRCNQRSYNGCNGGNDVATTERQDCKSRGALRQTEGRCPG